MKFICDALPAVARHICPALAVVLLSTLPFPVICQPVPSAPSPGAIDQPMDVEFRWRPNSSATYEVYIYQGTNSEAIQALYSEQTSVRARNLAFSTLYSWNVRGIDSMGIPGEWSALSTFTTEADGGRPVLTYPENFATGIPFDAVPPIQLSWTDPTQSTAWHVQVHTTEDLDRVNPITTTTTTHTLALMPSTQYFWRVRNMSAAGGPGKWSPVFSFTTDRVLTRPPGIPSLLSPQDMSEGLPMFVDFTWSSVRGATSYMLHLAPSAFPDSTYSLMATTEEHASIQLPPSQGGWQWKVQAISRDGDGQWSPVWQFRTLDTSHRSIDAPDLMFPVQHAVFNADSINTIQVSWAHERDDVEYVVEWSINGRFGDSTVVDTIVRERVVSIDVGVHPGDSLRYRVKAQTWWAESVWSEEHVVSFMQLPTSAPGAPVLISPANLATDVPRMPTFTWSASGNPTGYQLELARDEGMSDVAGQYSATETYVQTDTLESSKRYWWRVRAENTTGLGQYSAPYSFVTSNDVQGVDEAMDSHGISISPNPSQGKIHIRLETPPSKLTNVNIYDIAGRMVLSTALTPGTSSIDLDMTSESTGQYMMFIYLDSNVVSIPFTLLPVQP